MSTDLGLALAAVELAVTRCGNALDRLLGVVNE